MPRDRKELPLFDQANVLPLGDRLQVVPTERETEKMAEAQEAYEDELEADEFDETDPKQSAAVVFSSINNIAALYVDAAYYCSRYEPRVFKKDAVKALATLQAIVEAYNAAER